MRFVIFFFGSGLALFVGVALVLLAAMLFALRHRTGLRRAAPVTAITGLIFVALSAAPLPCWYYAGAGIITLAWLIIEQSSKLALAKRGYLRLIVAGVWITGAVLEAQYSTTPSIKATSQPALWIIGDSVSAGTGNPKIETWPRVLARKYSVVVHDHSQVGATVATALRKLDKEPLGNGLILLEIGGNDLLGTTTAASFEDRLDRLLAEVCQPGRTVLMFELPLPPFCNQYGMAQRRLAAQHGVILIPKRIFAEVLTTGDATLDGVHLSQPGHNLMAETVWSIIGPAYSK
jgi:acyl-CoA thioesterase-1